MSALSWLLGDSADGQSTLTASSAGVNGDSLTITLSAQADTTSTAVASDFTVSAAGEDLRVNSAGVNGSTVTLTLAESVGDADCNPTAITVSYGRSGSSITASGSELQDFTDLSVSNATDHAPAVESIESDATGQYIHVTFCEAIVDISFQWSDFSAFTVSINDETQAVNDLATPATTPGRLELQLSSKAIKQGDDVTLAYDRSSADENYPLQDLDQGGKLVESWLADDYDVANNVDSPPTLKSVSALYEVVTLTFSEALDENSVPSKDAFSIGGVQHAPAVEMVSISLATVTLTLSGILHNRNSPTYTLNYGEPNQSPLRQADGKHNVADISSFQFTSSTPTAKPAVNAAEVNGVTLTITFDIPLKAVAPASAFTIAGQSGVTVSAASFSGAVVSLTLSPAVSAGSTITVSYAKPASPPRIEGRNTVDADGFSNLAVTNNTPSLAPTFVSAAINAAGDVLSITLSADVLGVVAGIPAASAFALSGGTAAVGGVSVSGMTVSLTLAPPADVGESITVAYAQPTGEMVGKLQSLSGGHLVESWTAQMVTNGADGVPRPTGATVNGATLTISFDRSLDAMSTPLASAFTVAGATATVSAPSITGSTVTLTLSAAVTHDDEIAVSYVKPQTGGIRRAGQALVAESFTSLAVTNETPDPTPTFVSASIDAAGGTLSLTMSAALLETSAGLPAATAFTLGGGTASVGGVTVSGTTVSLTLVPKADVGETITVAYTKPTASADGKLQALSGGHLVDAWSAESVTNNADGVPRPDSATVNGATLVFGFDRSLDGASQPAASAFSLGGTTATVSAVSISGANVTLAMSAAVGHNDAITLTYAKPETGGLKRIGLALYVESWAALAVTNETPEPLVRSIVGDENEIVVTVSKPLETDSKPATSAFSLGEGHPTVSELSLESNTIRLELGSSLREGVAYTLTYAAPSNSPLTTAEAEAVASFSGAVTNVTDVAPTFESVVGNGATLTVRFDQPLDAMATVAPTSFSLSGDSGRTVTDVSIDGSKLALTL
ncbi:MAG: SwmB domain-containing protein, partial [Chloroflexi bacterium]|nr:SwmB domain-containing protein [Chloroflexota bacterium]